MASATAEVARGVKLVAVVGETKAAVSRAAR